MNKKLIKQLQNGEIAVRNDGTLEELREVLKVAFPYDKRVIIGGNIYYFRYSDITFDFKNSTDLKKVSVKDFFKPDELTLEELIEAVKIKAKIAGYNCDVVLDEMKESVHVEYVGTYIEENRKSEENELNIQFKITGSAFFNPHDLANHIQEYLENN